MQAPSLCNMSCGADASTFNNQTAVASHELVEVITDPQYTSGWFDNANGEIGDICQPQHLRHARAMPLITVYTSAEAPPDEKAQSLLRDLSSTFAQLLGKPERYVMTRLAPRSPMTFAGSPDPACYVEIKSIGGITRENA